MHVHHGEDELFHVLEGAFEFHVDGVRTRAADRLELPPPPDPPTPDVIARLEEVARRHRIEIVGPPLH